MERRAIRNGHSLQRCPDERLVNGNLGHPGHAQKMSHWQITHAVSCAPLHRINQNTARAQAHSTDHSLNLHRMNKHAKNEAPVMGWIDCCHATDAQADGRVMYETGRLDLAIGDVSDTSCLGTRRHWTRELLNNNEPCLFCRLVPGHSRISSPRIVGVCQLFIRHQLW